MPSNFTFLQAEPQFRDFADVAVEAERAMAFSPETAAIYARKALETAVVWVYEHDEALRLPERPQVSSLIHDEAFREIIEPELFPLLKYVIRMGNFAVHTASHMGRAEALLSLKDLFAFLSWVAYCYATSYEERTFNEALVPTAGADARAVKLARARLAAARKEAEAAQAKLAAREEELSEREAVLTAQKDALDEQTQALSEKERALAKAQQENERLRKEMEELRRAHQAARSFAVDAATEAETRRRFIDLDLQEAGWTMGVDCRTEVAVDGMPPEPGRTDGRGYADYVLYGKDERPLAVIEAKRTSRDVAAGAHQAVLYADALARQYGRRPFIFLTNGFETQFFDDAAGAPRRAVGGFFSQDDLVRRMARRPGGWAAARPLDAPELDDTIAGRPYQRAAVLAFCAAAMQHQRRMLLVQATGTGKTRVAESIVDVLTRSNWAKHILFLADRTALVKQAKASFADQFKNRLTLCNLCENKDDPVTSRVVFATYPTMMNAIDRLRDDAGRRLFSPGHFDLIVIDESHRSIYQKYQEIFAYFDALLLGLTATPKAEVGRDTYRVFGLADGVPTYNYDYDTAVREGYLVDYELRSYTTNLLQRGLHYKDLPDADKAQMEDLFGGVREQAEAGAYDVEPKAFNRWLFNRATIELVLARLMDDGLRIEGGDRIGKTIIFATNTRHARAIVDCFHAMYPELGDGFIAQVDYSIDYADDIIDRFRRPDALPQIAVSVDKLDTGVDVPDIVNLVFFKSVHSYSKFWQMIGRGTRLRKDLFGPGRDKTHFLIFDYGENFAYFAEERHREKQEKLPLPLSARVFLLRAKAAKLVQGAKDDRLRKLHDELVAALEKSVAALDTQNFAVRQHRRAVEKYRQTYAWNALSDRSVAELKEHVAPLVRDAAAPETVRRFDHLMMTILVASLDGKMDTVARQVAAVQTAAHQLTAEHLQAIPQVAAHHDAIARLARPDAWPAMDSVELEALRREVRALVQYITPDTQFYVVSDFADTLLPGGGEKLQGPQPSAEYRRKVEAYLREHLDELAVYKLRHNKPLTAADMKELERVFWQELGTREDYERAYANEPLGRLVRQITGMDEASVRDAFRAFLRAHPLSRDQLDFVERIVRYIAKNGFIDITAETIQKEPFKGTKIQELFRGQVPTWQEILAKVKEISGNTGVA